MIVYIYKYRLYISFYDRLYRLELLIKELLKKESP